MQIRSSNEWRAGKLLFEIYKKKKKIQSRLKKKYWKVSMKRKMMIKNKSGNKVSKEQWEQR